MGWNMVHELYVDVLFLVNFFMDYILLLFVKKVLGCDVKHHRIVSGGAIGAALYCILVILPIPNAFLEFILFHLLINTCMIRVGLKIQSISAFMKALILLYIGAFFMGGIMGFFYQFVRLGSLILLLAIAGYYLAVGMWKFLCRVQRRREHLVKVELYYKQTALMVTALWDSGNSLHDPMTGLPVSVLSKKKAQMLLKESQDMVRYIPFRSVGNGNGVMPVIRVKEMRILGEEPQYIERPLIGISEEQFSAAEEYELILNPNIC